MSETRYRYYVKSRTSSTIRIVRQSIQHVEQKKSIPVAGKKTSQKRSRPNTQNENTAEPPQQHQTPSLVSRVDPYLGNVSESLKKWRELLDAAIKEHSREKINLLCGIDPRLLENYSGKEITIQGIRYKITPKECLAHFMIALQNHAETVYRSIWKSNQTELCRYILSLNSQEQSAVCDAVSLCDKTNTMTPFFPIFQRALQRIIQTQSPPVAAVAAMTKVGIYANKRSKTSSLSPERPHKIYKR